MMPTRYQLDLDLKTAVTADCTETTTKRVAAGKEAKKLLEERYKSGKNRCVACLRCVCLHLLVHGRGAGGDVRLGLAAGAGAALRLFFASGCVSLAFLFPGGSSRSFAFSRNPLHLPDCHRRALILDLPGSSRAQNAMCVIATSHTQHHIFLLV